MQRPRVEYVNQIFRGVGYQDVPERPYDFVFVDGPHHIAPSDNYFVFDFDLINVVSRSEVPVFAVVDYRLTSCFVFQQLLGPEKARFDAVLELGFIGPCVREDVNPVTARAHAGAGARRAALRQHGHPAAVT